MILFDVFTFKRSITDLFSLSKIKELFELAREEIIKRIDKEMEGELKKVQVDFIITQHIKDYAESKSSNKLVLWLVDTVFIKAVPTVTQLIYDFLKEKVKGLTKLD